MRDLKSTKKKKKTYYRKLDIILNKLKKKPLMIAYILFLFICIFVHIFSNIFLFEFPMWQRIVVAATISSYAFTLSSSPKLMSKSDTQQAKYIEAEIAILQQTLSMKSDSNLDYGYIQEEINKKQEELETTKQSILKQERSTFLWEMVGFLVFFCILAFDPIYSIFVKSQELYTLFAFAFVLFMNVIESLVNDLYEDNYMMTKETYTTIIENLEKINNGKT